MIPVSRLLHSPNLVAVGLSVRYETWISLQNKCPTVDPDQQNLGWSGKLSFFIIYKFWKIMLRSGKFQILFWRLMDSNRACFQYSHYWNYHPLTLKQLSPFSKCNFIFWCCSQLHFCMKLVQYNDYLASHYARLSYAGVLNGPILDISKTIGSFV